MKVKIFLTIILINLEVIFSNINLKNDSSILNNDTINNIIEDLDKIISEIFDKIDDIEINMNDDDDDLLDNELFLDDKLKEIITDDNLNEINFETLEIIDGKNNIEEDEEDDESIWPERPIPKYKFIV